MKNIQKETRVYNFLLLLSLVNDCGGLHNLYDPTLYSYPPTLPLYY